MCDYSLKHLASRPAKVNDKLKVSRFRATASIGFTDATAEIREVICLLPGTELAFDDGITQTGRGFLGLATKTHEQRTAIFRQINTEVVHTHHDALELPDGTTMLLTNLEPGQTATVLQLPAAPKTAEEAKAQERLAVVA
jgi:hypothetical protein